MRRNRWSGSIGITGRDHRNVQIPAMSETPQILLAHHLKKLKLPTFLREHEKVACQSALNIDPLSASNIDPSCGRERLSR